MLAGHDSDAQVIALRYGALLKRLIVAPGTGHEGFWSADDGGGDAHLLEFLKACEGEKR